MMLNDQMIRIVAPVKARPEAASIQTILYTGLRGRFRQHRAYKNVEVIGMYSTIIAGQSAISILLDTIIEK